MPQLCVRCKSYTQIDEFVYTRIKKTGFLSNTTTIKSVTISFPVCRLCESKFVSFKKYESLYDSIWRSLLITIIISISILLYFTFYNATRDRGPPSPYGQTDMFDIIMWVLFVIMLLSISIFVCLILIVKKHPNRISQYIEMTTQGKVTIKDEQLIKEIEQKINKEIDDFQQNRNVIFCPKCGMKHNIKNLDFCRFCGKNMKGLINFKK